MYNTKYWFNLRELWTGFPTREMTGLFKRYYLVQAAFWLQQIVVVNIEERRKDYWQMFTHHIITSALIFGSYGYYQTKVGNAILCTMDVVDIALPVSLSSSSWAILLPDDSVGREDAEILRISNRVRHCVRRIHHHMDPSAPRFLSHDLLVDPRRCSAHHVIRVFHQHHW